MGNFNLENWDDVVEVNDMVRTMNYDNDGPHWLADEKRIEEEPVMPSKKRRMLEVGVEGDLFNEHDERDNCLQVGCVPV